MKPNSIRLGTIAIGAIAVFWSPAARAETIYLNCGAHSLVVDLTGKTVNGSYRGAPPAMANITPVSIDWTAPGQGAHNDYHIDRSTGNFTMTTVNESNGFRFVSDTASCTQVTAPQTKF